MVETVVVTAAAAVLELAPAVVAEVAHDWHYDELDCVSCDGRA